MSWVGIIITFALIDNVVLSRLLGVSDVDRAGDMRAALRLGIAMAVLAASSALAAWALDSLFLTPLRLGFLRTPVFVLAVAGLTLLLDMGARRLSPLLPRISGFSLPGLAINCAALGIVLIANRAGYSALQSVVAGLSAGLGYALVTALMTAIRERLEVEDVPPALRGLPLQLISAGLLAYAFMAFDRSFLARLLGG